MNLTRRRFVGMCAKAGLLAGGAGLAGCLERGQDAQNMTAQNTTVQQSPKVKGNYIDGTSGEDAETLNWILAADASSLGYIGLTMDGLIAYDNKYNILRRWLKKDIEASDNGLIYTVVLRDDLEWSDGQPVTSDDFVYTMKNIMFADWMAYPYAGDWKEEMDGKTVFVEPRVENETTFSIHRKTANPEFLYTVTDLMVYPKHIVSKYEGRVKEFTQAPELNNLSYTGNLGPYRFKEWVRSDKFVVERNPDYYLGREKGEPYFETYTVKIFGSPAARHAAMEAGDITSTDIDPEQVKKFKEMKGIVVYTIPTAQYRIMQYNMRDNGWQGLKDKRVRQAISMAVSKEAIVNQIYLGFGEPAFSFIPRTSLWFVEEGLTKLGVGELYNKVKALELLFDAGYGVRKGGKIELRDKNGSQIKLKLITSTGSKVNESIALLVKQELGNLGMDIEVKLVPWEIMLRKYYMNKVPGSDQQPGNNNGPKAVSEETWDLIIAGHIVDPLQPSGSSIFYASDGGLNMYGYSNRKVDELFAKVRTKEALDKEVRRQMYGEISAILSEDQPVDFIAFPAKNIAYKDSVKGIDPGVAMGYNYYEWYFE
ncbi:ABC transporter substrate-binding protein [Candidatus Methanoperedens nitratireducens]|uniref:Putative Peptide ABC transporter substrate-binding protein n=1 Tax=Candidatus Methanoperedens nitratireducens TaxID=1392998 RepID=A0A284VQQ1_9EURY|nr:ABC transporter substrate-binding protein [Candidatus Methanoperedens nitroreducens]SNQ61539.1 putative Peptide ABC transporter substrate-binding protein [Candidatus Methanoperedens nitroreducens]